MKQGQTGVIYRPVQRTRRHYAEHLNRQSRSVLFYVHRNQTVGTIRDGEPRTTIWTFTQLLSSETLTASSSSHVALRPQRPCGHLREGEPRTATSTFTQLLCSADILTSLTDLYCSHPTVQFAATNTRLRFRLP